jgi:transaldolase
MRPELVDRRFDAAHDRERCPRVADEGLRVITSNPTTFAKTVAGNSDHDHDRDIAQRQPLVIDETLLTTDVRSACDILRPVHDKTRGSIR